MFELFVRHSDAALPPWLQKLVTWCPPPSPRPAGGGGGWGGHKGKMLQVKPKACGHVFLKKHVLGLGIDCQKRRGTFCWRKKCFSCVKKKKVGRPLPGGRGLGACNVRRLLFRTCFLEDEMNWFGGN